MEHTSPREGVEQAQRELLRMRAFSRLKPVSEQESGDTDMLFFDLDSDAQAQVSDGDVVMVGNHAFKVVSVHSGPPSPRFPNGCIEVQCEQDGEPPTTLRVEPGAELEVVDKDAQRAYARWREGGISVRDVLGE